MISRANSKCFRQVASRQGFTLVELMLVLALIVIVAAMAAPALQGPVDDFRLKKSADLVRARWAKARSEAMRTGRTMMFRYQPGTGVFEIAPWQNEDDYLESSQIFGTGIGGAAGATGTASTANQGSVQATLVTTPRTEELGEGVQFFGSSTVADSRGAHIEMSLQTQAGQNWSPPILFYPDGTSSTSRVVLRNEREFYVLIQLRGLSGVAQVSELLTAAELPG